MTTNVLETVKQVKKVILFMMPVLPGVRSSTVSPRAKW